MSPSGSARCFVAVWPPPPLTEMLRAVDRPLRQGLRWTSEDQWHVTLRFLGTVERSELLDSMASLSAEAVVARAGPRPRRLGQMWVLPVTGLEPLAAALEAATAPLAPVGDRPFRGHLTLARARRPAALRGMAGAEIDYEWRVEEIAAVESDLRPEGARYSVLAKRGLGAALQ